MLYQMGAAMTQSVGYDLQLVYRVTSRSRPVLFLLPSQRILSQGESNVFKGKSAALQNSKCNVQSNLSLGPVDIYVYIIAK